MIYGKGLYLREVVKEDIDRAYELCVNDDVLKYDGGYTSFASKEYIKENYNDYELSVDKMCLVLHLSPAYFSTIFKRLNGISPWDYITIKRIEQSIEYLESTDSSILEIACRCGFNNTANFNRAFKKITGKTPSEYR